MAMHYVVLAFLISAASLPARAEIYECIDQNGNKRFTNIAADARGCRTLDVGLPSSPPPAVSAPVSRAQPRVPQVATPTSFPRVERQVQRERDSDRRRILEHELGQEEKLLADAKRDLSESARAGGDDSLHKKIRLHENNVASLRKEISKIR
jgi:uncharacterized protein DUF4124